MDIEQKKINDELPLEEQVRLLEEYGDRPEVIAIMNEFFTPEMMSKEVGSPEAIEYLERVNTLLRMLDKEDSVKRGTVRIQ
jgi:hypothetical protein